MEGKRTISEEETQRKHEDILRSLEETKSGLITTLEHLKLTLKPIGVGFWGEVYKVVSESNEPQMVLKLNKATNCESRRNMLKEVNIMRSLDHPNIVRFHGVCVHNNQLHPLLEFINGGTLEELLQNQSVELPWDTRLSIARDIANGMDYLHRHKIMHRDLTSNNILLKIDEETRKVTALLADFGLATNIAPNAHAQTVRSVVGTVDWMAPEVILGEPYNFKADVFSYGIILCELIGRCEADPDVLPRTRKFEVDFDEFAQLACEGCPPVFLKLAKECCSLLPDQRPEFPEILQEHDALIHSIQLGQESIDIRNENNVDRSLETLNISEDTADIILKNLAIEFNSDMLNDTLLDGTSPTTSYSMMDKELLNLTKQEPRYKEKISGGGLNILTKDRYKHLDPEKTSRRSSIITLTPSVNRDNGRICLTFINDNTSSFDMTSPVPESDNALLTAKEIFDMQQKDGDKAISDLCDGANLVLFKPELTFSTKHATCDDKAVDERENTLTKDTAIPYAKRHFSQKKKINPSFTKLFRKNSPKHSSDGSSIPKPKESPGIFGFFRSLSTKNSTESQSKSKIQKRKQSDDKLTGGVTKVAPHMSPKHVKQKLKLVDVLLTPTNSPNDPIGRIFNNNTDGKHASDKIKSSPNLTAPVPASRVAIPSKRSRSSTQYEVKCACRKDLCPHCFPSSPRIHVARNESYRQMKAYRAQSIPSETDSETKKPGRSKSFREKFFLSDKSKNTRI